MRHEEEIPEATNGDIVNLRVRRVDVVNYEYSAFCQSLTARHRAGNLNYNGEFPSADSTAPIRHARFQQRFRRAFLQR
jgi:hypothetical protein